MMSDSNPVVIVSYNNHTDGNADGEEDHEMRTELMRNVVTTKIQVGKSNSFPISTDYLRVPTSFSNYETSSSIYSSDESLEPLYYGRVRSASEYTTTSSNEKTSSEGFCLERKEECASALQLSKTASDNRKSNDIIKIFKKNLKRTVSAPIEITHDSNGKLAEDPMTTRMSPFLRRKQLFSPKSWIRSRAKDEDEKSSTTNRFSLRRTFSNTLRAPFSGKESSYEITFPTKYKKKPQKYRIVDGRTGRSDGISFEVIGKQGTYLRVKGAMLIPDKDTSDTYFNKDCTFVPLPDMWFPSFFAFESISKPSYFIRLTENEELVIDKFDGTNDFKEEASFQLNRKLCATCLQVGVQTWGKQPTGEYCLGKVFFVNNENVKVQFEDNKKEVYSKSDTTRFVPDIVPCSSDICVGTRVLAQWSSRHTLYPGVVDSIHKGNTYDVLFDDGDNCRVKAFQIRLVRTYSFIHDAHHDSDASSFQHDSCRNRHSVQPKNIQANKEDKEVKCNQPICGKASCNEIHVLNGDSQCHTYARRSPMQGITTRVGAFPQWEIETYSQDSGYHGCDKGKVNQFVKTQEKNKDYIRDDWKATSSQHLSETTMQFPNKKSANELYSVRTNRVTFNDIVNSHSLPEFRCESPTYNHINAVRNNPLIKSNSTPVDWHMNNETVVKEQSDGLLKDCSIEIINHTGNDIYDFKPFVENDEESDQEFVNISLTSLNTIELLSLQHIEHATSTSQDNLINESKNKPISEKPPSRFLNVGKMDIIRERADSVCQTSII